MNDIFDKMSFHMDRKEFFKCIQDGDLETVWQAYQYAVRGGESTTLEKERHRVNELKARIELLERVVTKLGVDAMLTEDDEEAVLRELATEDRYYEITGEDDG
jgi:hypothetical protein